jgi:hypothetical protein
MTVRITSQEGKVALFDGVSGWAFGPTFDTEEEADDFLAFSAHHPELRLLPAHELQQRHRAWLDSKKQLATLTGPDPG